MRNLKLGRPSPALVVALVALFAALGGSAYAASTIGTRQIKNGAVTAAKLKKEAVTAAKIRNGAITGAKLDLAQLGTVPSASHAASANTAGHAYEADKATEAAKAGEADHAKSADTATTANLAVNFSHYFSTGIVKASVGEEVPIWQVGPFTAVGHCERVKDTIAAWTSVTTSAPHSTFNSYLDRYGRANFEPGIEAQVGYTVSSAEPETNAREGYYVEFFAFSPDGGVRLHGSAINNVNYFGADCSFLAEMTNGG